jgi:hypothetical protein
MRKSASPTSPCGSRSRNPGNSRRSDRWTDPNSSRRINRDLFRSTPSGVLMVAAAEIAARKHRVGIEVEGAAQARVALPRDDRKTDQRSPARCAPWRRCHRPQLPCAPPRPAAHAILQARHPCRKRLQNAVQRRGRRVPSNWSDRALWPSRATARTVRTANQLPRISTYR